MPASSTKARDELELELMRAQIEQLSSSRNRALVRDLAPALIVVAILVSGALLAGSMVSNYWEMSVNDAQAELGEIEDSKASMELELSNLQTSVDLAGSTGIEGSPVDLAVDFQSCDGTLCSVSATSRSQNVTLAMHGPCNGAYSIPGDLPEFGSASCQTLTKKVVCSSNQSTTMCRFGPFLSSELISGYWITATSAGETSARYVTVH